MRALVVFESMFGNTAAVARAVGEGLAAHTHADVTVVEVGSAPLAIPADVALLVVGGPTHAFGLSRPGTRESAVQKGATPVTPIEAGLREWLGMVTADSSATLVAAFDTRIRKPLLPGSAARAALKRLRRLNLKPVVTATSFGVTGMPGPLVDGELDRARTWGADLAAHLP